MSTSYQTPWSVVDALKPGAALLEWMVLVSLLSWARDEDTKSFGWWASALAGRRKQFGSFLWRLVRAKMLAQTVADAAASVRQALAWMTEQGIVDTVEADAERNEGRLELTVTLFRGAERTDLRFNDLWEAIRAR